LGASKEMDLTAWDTDFSIFLILRYGILNHEKEVRFMGIFLCMGRGHRVRGLDSLRQYVKNAFKYEIPTLLLVKYFTNSFTIK
jgi:hypothetical protein